jgi:glycosyltransferase involved in cell wall biosynthesis
MQKLVSIITPTFNSEKFVQETILSIQNQTYENWELILIDDCSTDNTFEILNRLSAIDSRLKPFRLPTSARTGAARNFSLSKCAGNYIAFLDADDLWKRTKLEVQLGFIHKHNLKFTFSFYDLIDVIAKI